MNDMTDVTNFDWAGLWEMVKTTGVDFGIQVLIALIIFFVGRIVARMVQRGLRKVMQAREVDKILETFVSNLAYWALMTFVIIAATTPVAMTHSIAMSIQSPGSPKSSPSPWAAVT